MMTFSRRRIKERQTTAGQYESLCLYLHILLQCPSVGEEGNEVAIDPSVVWPVGSYTVQSKTSLVMLGELAQQVGLKLASVDNMAKLSSPFHSRKCSD